jgi:hypothetical protein
MGSDRAERHVLVPVEPTPEMIDAAMIASVPAFRRDQAFAIWYKAMLSAAPPVQMEAVAWRWRLAGSGTWVHTRDEPKSEQFNEPNEIGKDIFVEPLYAHPAPPIPSGRDDIIEMCAKVADDYGRDGRLYKELACETADELAARIRALKGGA